MDSLTQLARRLEPLIARKARDVARRVIMAAAGAGIWVEQNVIHLSGAVILLRHPGAARLAEYPATTEGLQAALAAAVAGDTVLLPGGVIAPAGAAATLTVSASRATVKALVYPGSAPAGWNEAGFDDSAWSAPDLGTGVSGVGAAEVVWLGSNAGNRELLRQSFTLSSPVASAVLTWDGDDTTNGVYVNGVLVDSWAGWISGDDHPPRTVDVAAHLNPSGENVIAIDQSDAASGSWRGVTWELEIEQTGISIPAGVEVVGLGKNTILDGDLVNNGILTNCTVTGTVTGTGKLRMVYNASGEQITDLVGFAAADHDHDTAYAAISHDHAAGDIDSTGASDGQVLTADGLGGAAWETPAGGSVAASAVSVDASGFAGNLSAADTTVQAALQTIDAMTVSSGGAAPGHAETIGDGAATSYTITHDLGTADVIVQVYDLEASPNPVLVDATVEIVDEDTVLVAFDSPPSTDQYRVVVVAVSEGAGGGSGDSTYTAAYASRPAASSDGNLFLPSDGMTLERDTGSAWVPWGPIFPLTPPPMTDWTWVNQDIATASFGPGVVRLIAPPATGDKIRILARPAPAPPYMVTALIQVHMAPVNYNGAGIGWRDPSSGRLSRLGYIENMVLRWDNFSSPTNYHSAVVTRGRVSADPLIWLRLVDDGTNRKTYWSSNGLDWDYMGAVARSSYVENPTELIIHANSNNATQMVVNTLLSWKVE